MAAKKNNVSHPLPTVTMTAYLLFLSHLKTPATTDSDGIREHGSKQTAETLK
jgi:hypothetical protein